MDPVTLTARWLFPVGRPPLPHGTITIQGEHILAVDGPGTRAADIDLGNVAILPGFVNAHTHLDLSDALGQCPPSADFTVWLRAVIAHRRRQTPDDIANAIDIGLSQCLRYGTTLVGDISAQGQSWDRLAQAPLRAVVFFEMLGLTKDRSRASLQSAQDWLDHHPDTPTCRAGLSPHAPYSVRASLWEDLDRDVFSPSARSRRFVPTAFHIAESEAEMQLLSRRQGPFVEFLKELSVWDPSGFLTDLREFVESRHQADPSLFIHGNYLSSETDLGGATLVYCPRTHAAFGHKNHPFRAYLAKGARVVLGTDSLASNPDLDLLAEARFVHQQHPDLPGATLLEMITLQGAAALNWDNETGSLAPGKSADLVILPLPESDAADPHALVLESSRPISGVFFRGNPDRSKLRG